MPTLRPTTSMSPLVEGSGSLRLAQHLAGVCVQGNQRCTGGRVVQAGFIVCQQGLDGSPTGAISSLGKGRTLTRR